VPRGVELQAESDGTTGMACCETFSAGFVGMTTYQDCFDWFVRDVENDPSIMASNVGNNSMYQGMIAAFPHEMDKVGVSVDCNVHLPVRYTSLLLSFESMYCFATVFEKPKSREKTKVDTHGHGPCIAESVCDEK
jgi:hypothetical protein